MFDGSFMASEIARRSAGGGNSATELVRFWVTWVFRMLHTVIPASFERYLCLLLIISSPMLHSIPLLLICEYTD